MTRPAAGDAPEDAEHPLAHVISLLLIVGVGLSAVVLAVGVLLLLVTGQTGYSTGLSPELVLGRAGSVPFPRQSDRVLRDALALKPFAVIELGLAILIATPVFRVAASVVLFLYEKDRIFAVITLAVLVLLLLSLFWIG